MSANGMPNTSCSTNASRSAGVSASSTTSNARPTESASSASCSGSTVSDRVRHAGLRELLPPGAPRSQHVQTHPTDHRRQPGPQVLYGPGILVANPQPAEGHPRFRSPTRASGRRPREDAAGAARTVRSATRASGSVDVRTIRGRHRSAVSSRARVMPSPSGRPTSTRSASGFSSRAAAVAVATLSASPTTTSPSATIMRRAGLRKTGSSSTTRTVPGMARSSQSPAWPRVGRTRDSDGNAKRSIAG
jgi:hypothetical protein